MANEPVAVLSRRLLLSALAGVLAMPAGAQPSPERTATPAPGLRALAAGSALHGLRPAAVRFAATTGIAVAVATDHGHNIRKSALAGTAPADVIVVPTEWANEIVAAGKADRTTMIAIGAVRIGAAVRSDAAKPDVSTMAALGRELLNAEAVLLTLAPTGDHLMAVIERLGLAAAVKPKLQRFDTATLLNKHLTEHPGVRMLGFGPATEIKAWRDKGVAWGGAIPDEIQIVLPYSAAMLTGAPQGPARHFLAYLASEPARQDFLASGVE